jgi:hypothetical protein
MNVIELFQLVSHSVCHGFATYTEWSRDILYGTGHISGEASVPEFGEPGKCNSYGKCSCPQITASVKIFIYICNNKMLTDLPI